MFFVLSKTVAFLLLPSNFLLLLLIAGVVLMLTRWRRAGFFMTAAAVVLFALAGLLPIGTYLVNGLEQRFPRWDARKGAPDGIIILGGGLSPELTRAHAMPIVGDAGRILAIGELARRYPNARIVYSGGDGNLIQSGLSEAMMLGPVLDQLGVPRERVMLEGRSRNTWENAVFTKEMVQPKPGERWLLVTTAWHIPRAVGCFRRAGFDVEAYPVGYATGRTVRFRPGFNAAGGLERLDLAAHEWLGLIAYRIAGRTDALLPAPAR